MRAAAVKRPQQKNNKDPHPLPRATDDEAFLAGFLAEDDIYHQP
jgi:hypothetical protein